jgi:hypothetical protein
LHVSFLRSIECRCSMWHCCPQRDAF